MITVPMTVSASIAEVAMVVNPDIISLGAELSVGYMAVNPDPYEGAYEIAPLAHEAQILPTKDKLMTDDLTVLKVPYFQTSNQYGDTVYIASEV